MNGKDGGVGNNKNNTAGISGESRRGEIIPEKHTTPFQSARFRFYAELNDFLPDKKRQREFDYLFHGSPGLKDAVEALGIPHTEIDLILANGSSVGFDYRLSEGDSISVYPVFESLDISPAARLRPAPLRETSFILDVHLGKLARLLRILGFDCAYKQFSCDREIIECSLSERRIILTRDIGLLKAKDVTRGYWVRSTDPEEQILEVVRRFDLRDRLRPFSRCSVCNGNIEPADTAEASKEAPPNVREWCGEYYRCGLCGKLYWKGTHFRKLEEFVERVINAASRAV